MKKVIILMVLGVIIALAPCVAGAVVGFDDEGAEVGITSVGAELEEGMDAVITETGNESEEGADVTGEAESNWFLFAGIGAIVLIGGVLLAVRKK